MATWEGAPEPEFPKLTFGQTLRFILRALGFLILFTVTFPIYLLGVLVDRITGWRGGATAMIWVFCAIGARLLGLRVVVEGTPMRHGGARVANHSSWLDIFAFRTAAQIFFVAKSEVSRWPGVGFIARSTGTAFIARKRTDAKRQEALFLDRLQRGDRLCFFPEGTSTDGLRVLPFKSSLFAAFTTPDLRDLVWVQPMTAIYEPADHLPVNFYGWWGDMDFAGHVMQVLGRSVGGQVRVIFSDPVRAANFADRKALAAHCEAEVRKPHEKAMRERGITAP